MRKEAPQTRRKLTSTPIVAGLTIMCCALWASAIPGIRLGYHLLDIAPGDMGSQLCFAGARFFCSGLAILAVHALKSGHIWPKPRAWRTAAKIGAFQTFGQYVLFYTGLAHATGVTGSITQGASVFMMIAFSCLVFRTERISRNKVVGCCLGFVGLLAATGGPQGDFGLGELLVLLSTVSGAVATNLMRKDGQSEDPVELAGLQFMLGGIALFLVGLSLGGSFHVAGLPQAAIFSWLAMVSAVGFSVWSLLLRDNDVSRVAVYQFLIPVFGVIFSLAALGSEGAEVGLNTIAALALISLGIVVVNRGSGTQKTAS